MPPIPSVEMRLVPGPLVMQPQVGVLMVRPDPAGGIDEETLAAILGKIALQGKDGGALWGGADTYLSPDASGIVICKPGSGETPGEIVLTLERDSVMSMYAPWDRAWLVLYGDDSGLPVTVRLHEASTHLLNDGTDPITITSGGLVVTWNKTEGNWYTKPLGGGSSGTSGTPALGDPLLRAAADPATANLMRLGPSWAVSAATLPLTDELLQEVGAFAGSGGSTGAWANRVLGHDGLPSVAPDTPGTTPATRPIAPFVPTTWDDLHVLGTLVSDPSGGSWLDDGTLRIEWRLKKQPAGPGDFGDGPSGFQEMVICRNYAADPHYSTPEFGILLIGQGGTDLAGVRPGWHWYLDYADSAGTPLEWLAYIEDQTLPFRLHHGIFTMDSATGVVTLELDGETQVVADVEPFDGFPAVPEPRMQWCTHGWHGTYLAVGTISEPTRVGVVDVAGFAEGQMSFADFPESSALVTAALDRPALLSGAPSSDQKLPEHSIVDGEALTIVGRMSMFGTSLGHFIGRPDIMFDGSPGWLFGGDLSGLTEGAAALILTITDGTLGANLFAFPGVTTPTMVHTDSVFAFRFDRVDAESMALFIDGVKIGEADITGLEPIVVDDATIGVGGLWTYLAMFDRALSDDEIAYLSADPEPFDVDAGPFAPLFPPPEVEMDNADWVTQEQLDEVEANAQAAAAAAAGDAQVAAATYTDAQIAALGDLLTYRGPINCSASPNYPAADAGDSYKVSASGKIGGASGPNVEVGDTIVCNVDGTAAGTAAAVGANWTILQVNLDGAVIGPTSAADNGFVVFDGVTGRIVKAATTATVRGLLGTGTPGATNYLRGDGAWAVPLVPPSHLFASGQYTASHQRTGAGSATANRMWYVPMFLPIAMSFTELACSCEGGATASQTVKMLVYSDTYAVIYDPGVTDSLATTGVKKNTFPATQVFGPGLIHLGLMASHATPTFAVGPPALIVPDAGVVSNGAKFQATAGVAPNPGSPGTSNGTQPPVIYIRQA